MKATFTKVLFLGLAVLFLFDSTLSGGIALFVGVLSVLLFKNPYQSEFKKNTSLLLGLSVAGLGAGMNLKEVAKVGFEGLGYTAMGIGATFLLGYIFSKILKIEKEISILITSGTAICGGSAIAAVAPVIQASPQNVSVALGTVFMLNAVALFLFPWLGHLLNLTQIQFGFWSALAIHDTSSVVGASLVYGEKAMKIATTVKLARALWIVPVAFIIGSLWKKEKSSTSAKRPWFILWFLLVATFFTIFSDFQFLQQSLLLVAKRMLVLTLFFIGASLSRDTLKSVGIKPFLYGVILWLSVGVLNLFGVLYGFIH